MESKADKYEVPPRFTILFQGDSITEAGRDYTRAGNLGTGYVKMVAGKFLADHVEEKVRFLNRGVTGNKIRDLKNRWQKDCLNLKPDIVSILIGINDAVFLSKNLLNKPTSTRSFEEDYRVLLEQTRDVLGAKIVLLTPFIVDLKPPRIFEIT